MLKRSLLALSVAALVLAGCKKKEDAADVAAPVETAPAAATTPASEATPAAPAAAPAAAKAFDINTIAVSDKPLGEWPYVVLPAGYNYSDKDDLKRGTKDLARVPFWTGGELLWVEGKVFENSIFTDDGKTYSQFELRKGIQQAIEALGGVRVADKTFDEATYNANEAELKPFRSEFDTVDNAYWYGNAADTYVIRRADKAIWVVTDIESGGTAGVLVAEGPLPAPAAH